jgi:MFS family permease
MKQYLKSNIWKYYLYNFFYLFLLLEPVLFIYFIKNLSFNLTQMMTVAAVFTFLTGIFEIPTGVVGDKLGYKKTLFLGAIVTLIGVGGYAMANNFYQILIAEVFWALGFSFNSGTCDSFLYDTLKNLKREKEFNKINGRATAIFWLGLATSAIFGGLLAKVNLALPIKLSFIPLIIPIFIVLSLKEPKRKLKKSTHLQHIVESLKYAFSHKKLRFMIFYGIIIFLIIEGIYNFFQPFMDQVGINIAFFGFIFGFGFLMSGTGALISHKVEKFLGEKKLLYSIYFIVFITLLFLSFVNSLWVLIGILIMLILDGIQGPAIADYLNKNIESHNRATVNSVSNLTRTVSLAIAFPILGRIGDLYGINRVFLVGAIFIGASFLLIKIWYKRI